MKERFGVVLAASVVISVGAILCTFLLSRAFIRVRTSGELIRVVGSARKSIRSDFIIWQGVVTRNSPNVTQAYAELKTDMDKTTQFLLAKGIPESEIVRSATNIRTLYVRDRNTPAYDDENENQGTFRQIAGYELTQRVEIRSARVELVEKISRESTELLSQGVRFASQNPMYLYTKLSDLKVSMQAEAAKDARARATQIAINAGCSLGRVRSARMSTPQLTPLYASQENDGGMDDTTALDKKITAIVSVDYAIR